MGPHPHSLQNPTLTACGTPPHSLRDSTLTHHRTHPCTRGAYLRTPWDPFSADADVTPRNPTLTPHRTPSSQLVSPHPYTLPDLPLAPCGNPATLAPCGTLSHSCSPFASHCHRCPLGPLAHTLPLSPCAPPPLQQGLFAELLGGLSHHGHCGTCAPHETCLRCPNIVPTLAGFG